MYEVSCGTVPRKPWIEDDMMDINSIFINLELIERQDHRKVDKPEQFKDYTEIFNNEDFQKCKKCVISGDPGSGKTTLVSKIAFDWANQKLGKFDYVLVLKLREIASQGGLLHHLSNIYSDSGVISMLESGKHGPVLLILDGFDEMNQDLVNTELGDLLEGKIFPAVQLLITTRPHSLLVLKKYPHITLNVMGFSVDDIKMYISKYFGGKHPDRASQVILQCVQDNRLWNLVENPLCCLMLCFLYESCYADKSENYTMPNNVTKLYTELVEVFQEIYERKWKSNNWKDIFKKLGHLALDMLFAEKNGVLIFEDKLLNNYGIEPSEACKAGLVTRIESIKRQTSTGSSAVFQSKSMYYSFIHKSLQEFTAALYVLSYTQEEYTKLSSQIADLDCDTFCSLELFITFIFDVACTKRRDGCGVHDERNICSILLAKSAEYFLSECLCASPESRVYMLMSGLCIRNKSHICEILTCDDRFQYLLAAFKHKFTSNLLIIGPQYHCVLSVFVTQDITKKLLDHGIHITMRELFRDGEPNISDHEMSVLVPFVNSFVLESTNLERMQFKTVMQARHLAVIDLFQCKFQNQTSFYEFLSLIHQFPKLHTYRMCKPVILSKTGNTPLNKSNVISMCRGNQLLCVKTLELSGCTEGLSLIFLQQLLPLCTQLLSLALSFNTSQDLHPMFFTLPGSLKVLHLGENSLTKIDIKTLFNQIDKLPVLEFLSMCGMFIRITQIESSEMSTIDSCCSNKTYCDDLRQLSINISQYCGNLDAIFQTLSKLSHRLDLNLSGLLIDNEKYHSIKSTAASIVGINMRACRWGHLNPENVKETWKSLKQLKSLNVSMINDHVGHLNEIISMMPNSVEVLDVSGSDIFKKSLEHLYEFVRRKHFKKFRASGVLIQSDKATSYALSISLHDCTSFTSHILGHCLRKMNISMLKLGDVNKDSFIDREIRESLLHVLLCLDKLSLSQCDTQSLKDFISYVHNSTQLQEMYLSGNSLKNIEGEFFSLLHSPPIYLETLDLSWCDLTTNSMQCILKELCRFTHLRELNLSGNSLEDDESVFFSFLPSFPTSLLVLDLSDCHLTTNTAQCIFKELCRCTHLRQLNLSGNSLEDDEIELFSLLHSLSNSLEVLNLSGCYLTTKSVYCVLKELCRFKQLRELNFSRNSLEHVESGIFSLVYSLSTSLEVLDLSHCNLPTDSVQCILKEFTRFTQLRELNFSRNSLQHVESGILHIYIHSLLLWKYLAYAVVISPQTVYSVF